MFFQRFYTDSIAQASFLIGSTSTGEAVVVDPNRDVDVYLESASREGLKVVAVTETHIHADFVSGSRELASITGATLYLSNEGGPDWQYQYAHEPNVQLIGSGGDIVVGDVRLHAVHTPGHTPEHLTFLLFDESSGKQLVGALTGDFIFVGDVGRPDLLEVAAGFRDTMRLGAQSLFASLTRFKHMPDSLVLWPGHGAGSACGKQLGSSPSTTLGTEKTTNPSVRIASEAAFIDDVLSGQPEPPKYFSRMKTVNKNGPTPARGNWNVPRVETQPSVQLVDVRPADKFLEGSEPRAVSIPLTPSFTKWAGSLLNPEQPVQVLAEAEQQALDAVKALYLIGIEKVVGWTTPKAVDKTPIVTEFPSVGTVLDVRTQAERTEKFIPGSIHVPLAYLADWNGLTEGPIYVHCASGGRALVGASYLRSKGLDAVAIRFDLADHLSGQKRQLMSL